MLHTKKQTAEDIRVVKAIDREKWVLCHSRLAAALDGVVPALPRDSVPQPHPGAFNRHHKRARLSLYPASFVPLATEALSKGHKGVEAKS